jgi:pimeloyl-ACP methyl ester carboxylesterase
MPYTTSSDGARIHYEAYGTGDPVLMIMGLGSNAHGWKRSLPWISAGHQAIVFDNRGVGRSDVPEGAYSVEQMAADAASVLDACGHRSAHVIGMSLGGMIAQHVALEHAERVRSLVLLCTTPGGANAVPAPDEVMRSLLEGGADPATVYRRNAWFLYGEDTRMRHPERIEEDLVERSRIPTTPTGYFGQIRAAARHDVWDGLPGITVPTLVVHGDADVLVPTGNGRRIAARVPGAELVLIPGAGHMLQADAGDALREAVLGFLARAAR